MYSSSSDESSLHFVGYSKINSLYAINGHDGSIGAAFLFD